VTCPWQMTPAAAVQLHLLQRWRWQQHQDLHRVAAAAVQLLLRLLKDPCLLLLLWSVLGCHTAQAQPQSAKCCNTAGKAHVAQAQPKTRQEAGVSTMLRVAATNVLRSTPPANTVLTLCRKKGQQQPCAPYLHHALSPKYKRSYKHAATTKGASHNISSSNSQQTSPAAASTSDSRCSISHVHSHICHNP
jgi:hypothetical protein